jgi:hypothetical protein
MMKPPTCTENLTMSGCCTREEAFIGNYKAMMERKPKKLGEKRAVPIYAPRISHKASSINALQFFKCFSVLVAID